MSDPGPPPPHRWDRALRWALVPVLLVLGAEFGLAEAFLVPAYGAGLPFGMALAVLANLALGWTAARATGSRLSAALTCLGWLAAMLPMGISRPEGDLVVLANARGEALLLVGALSVALPVLWVPARLGRPRRTGR